MTDCVLLDMDGTAVDVRGVLHYVQGPRRNYDAFHRASLFCPPNTLALNIARAYARGGAKTVVVTARDSRYERVTRDWLAKYRVEHQALYMRPWGDTRRDTVVKHEILRAVVAAGYVPVLAIDDRTDVAAVWESAGIRTILIPGGKG